MSIRLNYPEQSKAYDEMFHGESENQESITKMYSNYWLLLELVNSNKRNFKLVSINQGITFTVYSDGKGIERIFIDLIPASFEKQNGM